MYKRVSSSDRRETYPSITTRISLLPSILSNSLRKAAPILDGVALFHRWAALALVLCCGCLPFPAAGSTSQGSSRTLSEGGKSLPPGQSIYLHAAGLLVCLSPWVGPVQEAQQQTPPRGLRCCSKLPEAARLRHAGGRCGWPLCKRSGVPRPLCHTCPSSCTRSPRQHVRRVGQRSQVRAPSWRELHNRGGPA